MRWASCSLDDAERWLTTDTNTAINYRLKAEDLTYIFGHADVDAVLVDAEFVPLLDDFKRRYPRVPFIVDADADGVSGEYDAAVREGLAYDVALGAKGWDALEVQTRDEEGLIALAYTSGTTARPKGVMYSPRGCYLAAMGNIIESGLNPRVGRCAYLWTLPMFHAMGEFSRFLIRTDRRRTDERSKGWTFPWAVTAVRGTHYCLRKIDPAVVWRLLKNEGITHFNAAPTVNTMLCNAPEAERLAQPVQVTVAASPPTGHLFEQMTNLNLHPVHVYGLTETYGPLTKGYILPEWHQLQPSERYGRMARQGHGFITSLPVRVAKTDVAEGVIEDVARDGKQVGEIVFSGNICVPGYYKDAEATRKLFAGGVLHSGDLAVWHPDGAVQIIDRGKDIIISGKSCLILAERIKPDKNKGGENISSLALESVIVTHPDILEATVVAVKDEKWGERPKVFVTAKERRALDGGEVLAWTKKHPQISGFMVPREVEVVKELPKTSTGKVRKNVLREWARGADRSTTE